MKRPPRLRMLLLISVASLACVLAGCAHLKPTADTDPPRYEDPGQPGILDCLAQFFWPWHTH